MNVAESLRMSWRSIRAHSLRSTLTTLGIVIGVGAVVTFVFLGTSLQAAIIGDVAAQRQPTMVVSAGPESADGPVGGGAVAAFTERDVARLRNLSDVATVVPQGPVRISALRRGEETVAWQALVATTPEAFGSAAVADGRGFERNATELVLNRPAAALFEPNATVGDRVAVELGEGRVRNATVVGILNGSGGLGAFGESQPQIYAPTDPFYETSVESPTTGTRQRAYPVVTVRATEYEHVPAVEAAVERYLANESDASRLLPDAYEIRVQTNEQLVEQIREVLNTLTGFVTGVAVISLIVGSIGIANIMLVSVTERTREIGVMKAVGAQNRDVLQLFLVEAVVLGLVGSLLGSLVGLAGGYLAADYAGFALVVAPEWFAIAAAVGVGVGVAAGLYPAWSAARVDPIDALRYE